MKRYCMIVMSVMAVVSCHPSLPPVASPEDFDAVLVTADVVAGERVTFRLDGDVDFINFYSGEDGSDYAYKDKDRFYKDDMLLSFSSAQYPKTASNPDCGRLYYSNDFPGIYEETWIKLATWHDITDMIVYPKLSDTNYVLYDTDDLPLDQFFAEDPDSPIYFCWMFTTEANSKRTRFRIDNWSIHGADEEKVFYSFVESAFVMVQGKGFALDPSSSYYPRVTDKYILWDGVYESAVKKEGWAISGPIHYADAINAGHDKGISVKTIGDPVLKEFNHYYSEPGTYLAVFEAINSNAASQKSKIVKLTVNVAPAKETPVEEDKFIELSSNCQDGLSIPSEGGTVMFNLRAMSRWKASLDAEWARMDIDEGSAGHIYTVTVTANENTTGTARSAILTVMTPDGHSKTINITQNA